MKLNTKKKLAYRAYAKKHRPLQAEKEGKNKSNVNKKRLKKVKQ